MKNTIFLLILSLFFTSLVAQDNISLESEKMDARFDKNDKIPIVKGKLKNYSPDKHKDLSLIHI